VYVRSVTVMVDVNMSCRAIQVPWHS